MDTIQEQINKLRAAVKKDKATKRKHEVHLEYLDSLQKREHELENEITRAQTDLKRIKEYIVAAVTIQFDYSDDLVIAAAEETIKKLKKQL